MTAATQSYSSDSRPTLTALSCVNTVAPLAVSYDKRPRFGSVNKHAAWQESATRSTMCIGAIYPIGCANVPGVGEPATIERVSRPYTGKPPC